MENRRNPKDSKKGNANPGLKNTASRLSDRFDDDTRQTTGKQVSIKDFLNNKLPRKKASNKLLDSIMRQIKSEK